MNGEPKLSWLNFTNVLVTIAIAVSSFQWWFSADTANKLFIHMTNHEIHAPRSAFVEATQFDLYQKMRDKEMASFSQQLIDARVSQSTALAEIKEMIRQHEINSEKRQ